MNDCIFFNVFSRCVYINVSPIIDRLLLLRKKFDTFRLSLLLQTKFIKNESNAISTGTETDIISWPIIIIVNVLMLTVY